MVETCSIGKVKEKSDSYGEFSNYDKEDHIHGKHISKHSGASGYYSDFLERDLIEMVYRHLKDVFDAFGYEID